MFKDIFHLFWIGLYKNNKGTVIFFFANCSMKGKKKQVPMFPFGENKLGKTAISEIKYNIPKITYFCFQIYY